MVESVQTGLIQAAQVAQESELRQSPNGVRFAGFGETNLVAADLERMVQAVPGSVAAALAKRAFYFVPLALADHAFEAARRFLQAARFPKATVETTNTGFRVEIRDFSQSRDAHFEKQVIAIIETDPNGKVLSQDLAWDSPSK